MRLEWPSLDDCGTTGSLLRLLRIDTPTTLSAIAGTVAVRVKAAIALNKQQARPY